MSGISRDEWLAALGDAVRPCDPDALTIPEIMKQFGIGRDSARSRMRDLISTKKAVRVWKMSGPNRVVAYKLVKAKR